MYRFKCETDLGLLTVTRVGLWSLETVESYEIALRQELASLQLSGRSTSVIIDIRSGRRQEHKIADALRAMVERLGPLHADRTAVVTSSGVAKLQARRIADVNAQVFTSMALARDWITGDLDSSRDCGPVHDEPSDAEAEGPAVHVLGPSDVDILLTPVAALQTAKRIADVATEVLLAAAKAQAQGREDRA